MSYREAWLPIYNFLYYSKAYVQIFQTTFNNNVDVVVKLYNQNDISER
jgi:hypothetical protein